MTDTIGGPYIAAAFLCEKVLRESDGVNSFIRVVDRLIVNVGGSQDQPTSVKSNLVLVLMFKSGTARQKMSITIRPTSPTGKVLGKVQVSQLFEGEDRGVNIFTELKMDLAEEGVYWIDVLLEEELVTRIPLRLLYQRTAVSREPTET